MLKFVYALFIGLLIVAFVGLGIDAFYPGPERPEYPESITPSRFEPTPNEELTEEDKQQLQEERTQYENEMDQFQTDNKIYTRNVSIISIIIAIIVLTASVAYSPNLTVIADGMILGGVFTLIYGIIRGFEAEDAKFRFIVVTVGLAVSLIIGYIKFIKTENQKPDK